MFQPWNKCMHQHKGLLDMCLPILALLLRVGITSFAGRISPSCLSVDHAELLIPHVESRIFFGLRRIQNLPVTIYFGFHLMLEIFIPRWPQLPLCEALRRSWIQPSCPFLWPSPKTRQGHRIDSSYQWLEAHILPCNDAYIVTPEKCWRCVLKSMWPKERWSKGLALLFRSPNAVPDETQYPLVQKNWFWHES